ncbi:MAG: hypothetical protein IPM24_09725 [Bryobacterales bacterium]|nr:hypothetical protein [Bryobacterales bacterium]
MGVLIQDRDLAGVVGAAAVSILRGETLRNWWNSFPPVNLIDLPGSTPDVRLQYFFSTVPIDEVPTTVMGCIQRSVFRRRLAPGAPAESLSEWVGANFLAQCCWRNADGTPGGFQYRPALVLDQGGQSPPRRVEEDMPLRLAEIGVRYEWAVARLDLKDYMRAFPGHLGRFSRQLQWLNREAGYMMFHPNYFSSPYPRPEGWVDEYCFGYSVLPWQVMPTIAAYGAGRFHAAYKEYRFFLLEDGTVMADVIFLVAPRCERVFNILGFDPVFDTAAALNYLTFRRTRIIERTHFAVNHYAMGHHGRLHHILLAGMRRIWEETNWRVPARQPARSSASGR